MARLDATLGTGRKIDVQNGVLRVAGQLEGITIGVDPILVGRNPACGLCIPDRHVSAAHAEVVATPNGVRLRDLGSRNGTWVGGVRLVEAFLVESTNIVFGDVEASFEVGDKQSVALAASQRFHELYGANGAMRLLFTRLAALAPTDLTVLIEGETGTGKELVARSLHDASKRKKKPFVVIDCGSLTPGLAESLLFGHERGAFTGAIGARVSPFVQANGGTVFLDELGELPLDLQPKLLRALAERRVKPVGGDTYIPFDVRVVAATRRDLIGALNDGGFRSDLYFRVAQARVNVPPLRERSDDIPGLVRELLVALGERPAAVNRVPRESMMRLLRHDWPGNVRELRNAVTAAHAFSEPGGPIAVADHITDMQGAAAASAETSYHAAKRQALDRFERGFFSLLVAETGGSVVEIARRSELQRAHVRRYLKAHGLLLPRSERRRP
ncbi:MAG: sigma 54-interacting transcriptional regulator [Labilithrix sp.]